MSKNELLEVFRGLDETTIRQRLDELYGESAALRTILRSVLARNRAAARKLARTNIGRVMGATA